VWKSSTCARDGGCHSARQCSDLKEPSGSSFNLSNNREGVTYCTERRSLWAHLQPRRLARLGSPMYLYMISSPTARKDTLETCIGRQYLGCWKDDVLRLRATLSEKTWISFDLTTPCTNSAVQPRSPPIVIADTAEKYGTPIPGLREQYSEILEMDSKRIR
jgi:hypothetical protein